MSQALRAVTSVATGQRFLSGLNRLQSGLPSTVRTVFWRDCLPPNSPPHDQVPYGFKCYAIAETARQGFTTILWCDSSIVAIRDLEPIWKHIEKHGYWLPKNYDYTVGEFCSDEAMEIMGLTRAQAFEVPLVIATAFGLDVTNDKAHDFFNLWWAMAGQGCFKGPWSNEGGEASSDRRVRGHRHDQTAASVVAHELGMELTEPPKFICEQGYPSSKETILTIVR